MLYKLQV